MKEAIGKYIKVRVITERQAKNLAKKLLVEGAEGRKLHAEGRKLHAEGRKLHAEGHKLYAEGDKLYAEGDKLYAEGHKLYAEGDKLYAEGHKLYAEGRKLHAELAIKYKAYIPDYRAINLIAKDRKKSVYCFVFNRKEVWIYDGEHCPHPDTVEKLDWK